LSAEAFQSALNLLLPPHPYPGKNIRFVVALRYLPPWGPESQIRLTYDVYSRSTVTVWTLPKPLGSTLDGFLRDGGKESDLGAVVSSFEVKKDEFDLGREAGREFLSGFWDAVAGMAKDAPRLALKLDGTPNMQVVLDATLHQAFSSEGANYIEVSAGGPDPERVRNPDDLDSLVKWKLEVRHRFITGRLAGSENSPQQ
jgi:hypothetical protein